MATKLSDVQKALNKKAVNLRNKAFRERQNLYRAAVAEAEKTLEEGQMYRDFRAAQQALQDIIAARFAAEDEILQQIAALEEKGRLTTEEFNKKADVINDKKKETRDRYQEAKTAALLPIKQEFLDIDGLYSVVCWKPLDEFLKMAEAAD